MRRLLLAAALAWPGAPALADRLAECAAGLDRTLAVMEARPLMKEEVATALMWLRLDAWNAHAEGNAATCLRHLATVERILGLD